MLASPLKRLTIDSVPSSNPSSPLHGDIQLNRELSFIASSVSERLKTMSDSSFLFSSGDESSQKRENVPSPVISPAKPHTQKPDSVSSNSDSSSSSKSINSKSSSINSKSSSINSKSSNSKSSVNGSNRSRKSGASSSEFINSSDDDKTTQKASIGLQETRERMPAETRSDFTSIPDVNESSGDKEMTSCDSSLSGSGDEEMRSCDSSPHRQMATESGEIPEENPTDSSLETDENVETVLACYNAPDYDRVHPIGSCELSVEDLESDDVEVWMIQAPSSMDIHQLDEVKFAFRGTQNISTKGSSNKEESLNITYRDFSASINGMSLVLPSIRTRDWKRVDKPFAGKMVVSEVYAVPEPVYTRPASPSFDLPLGLKVRFKPFGCSHTDGDDVTRLNESDQQMMDDTTTPHKKKKKKKRRKSDINSLSMTDDTLSQSQTDDNPMDGNLEETNVLDTTTPHKKKKRRKSDINSLSMTDDSLSQSQTDDNPMDGNLEETNVIDESLRKKKKKKRKSRTGLEESSTDMDITTETSMLQSSLIENSIHDGIDNLNSSSAKKKKKKKHTSQRTYD